MLVLRTQANDELLTCLLHFTSYRPQCPRTWKFAFPQNYCTSHSSVETQRFWFSVSSLWTHMKHLIFSFFSLLPADIVGDKGLLNVSTYDILPPYKTTVDFKWHIKDVTEVQTLIILMRPSFTRSHLCIIFVWSLWKSLNAYFSPLVSFVSLGRPFCLHSPFFSNSLLHYRSLGLL